MTTIRKRRIINRPEQEQQQALFAWAKIAERSYPQLAFLFHPPNGGRRNPREAGILKSMGVKPGVPDVLLPVPGALSRFGLAFEFKAGKGRETEAQGFWLVGLGTIGWHVEIIRDWTVARDRIVAHLPRRPA